MIDGPTIKKVKIDQAVSKGKIKLSTLKDINFVNPL